MLLLWNKADKEGDRQVTLNEGVELASKEKYEFKESSCVHNQNVAGAFEYLVERWNYLNNKKSKDFISKRSNTEYKKKKNNISEEMKKKDDHNVKKR